MLVRIIRIAARPPALYSLLEYLGQSKDSPARLRAKLIRMTDFESATKAIEALKAAQREPAQVALPILNGLVGLVQGDHEQRLEVEEARSRAFLAICEVGKALHRGHPADGLWSVAISATERWLTLAK